MKDAVSSNRRLNDLHSKYESSVKCAVTIEKGEKEKGEKLELGSDGRSGSSGNIGGEKLELGSDGRSGSSGSDGRSGSSGNIGRKKLNTDIFDLVGAGGGV